MQREPFGQHPGAQGQAGAEGLQQRLPPAFQQLQGHDRREDGAGGRCLPLLGWLGTAAGGALRGVPGGGGQQRDSPPHLRVQLAEGRARPAQQTQLQAPQQR